MRYKTELRDTHDGKATYGAAFVQANSGAWLLIGHTNNYSTYPRSVRARTAAKNIVLKHAGWPGLKAVSQGVEIIEA